MKAPVIIYTVLAAILVDGSGLIATAAPETRVSAIGHSTAQPKTVASLKPSTELGEYMALDGIRMPQQQHATVFEAPPYYAGNDRKSGETGGRIQASFATPPMMA